MTTKNTITWSEYKNPPKFKKGDIVTPILLEVGVDPAEIGDTFVINHRLPVTTRATPLVKVTPGTMPKARLCEYYVIPVPVDVSGNGPCDLHEAHKMTYEVWDKAMAFQGVHDYLPDAIDQMNTLNKDTYLVTALNGKTYAVCEKTARLILSWLKK